LWAEWNGRYRDVVRRYWRGDDGQLAELRYRLTGSSDLNQGDGRHPTASINFITAHDGFTLADLVTYNEKHNEANQEMNRYGSDDNHSNNYGTEGPTDDPEIIGTRERQKRNFLAMLLLSQGVPMICGGDEIGRSQKGNNNAMHRIMRLAGTIGNSMNGGQRYWTSRSAWSSERSSEPTPAKIFPGPPHRSRFSAAAGGA
jgi:glycogen operon protein